MADLKEWTSYAAIDPELAEVLKKDGPRMPEFSEFKDIHALRDFLSQSKGRMSALFGGKRDDVHEKDYMIPMRDGAEILGRVYTPVNPPKEGSPLAVVFHGGGFCLGSVTNEDLTCRNLSSQLGMVCVNVEYRLAPEHKFPTAPNDALDATKWAISNASSFSADPSLGFILSGCSAGGNLAAVTALSLRDEGFSPRVTGCHLMIPLLCGIDVLPSKYTPLEHSVSQNGDAPILNHKNITFFDEMYCNSPSDREDIRYSPLRRTDLGEKGRFPPTYFQICGMDALRDQELIFEKVLREEAGVKTKVDIYQGQPHGFWSAFPMLKASKRFIEDSPKGVRWLLEQGK